MLKNKNGIEQGDLFKSEPAGSPSWTWQQPYTLVSFKRLKNEAVGTFLSWTVSFFQKINLKQQLTPSPWREETGTEWQALTLESADRFALSDGGQHAQGSWISILSSEKWGYSHPLHKLKYK